MLDNIKTAEEITVELINAIINQLNEKNSTLPYISIGVAIIIPLLSLWFTIIHNKKSEKATCLDGIKINIDNARQAISSFSIQTVDMQILKEKKNPIKEEKKKIQIYEILLNSLTENLYNAFEDGCLKFFLGKVDKKAFREKYHDAIIELVKREADKTKFVGPTAHFTRINDYYEKYNKPKA